MPQINELIDLTIKYLDLYVLLPLLYAETHYRFKYFFSYLNKNEPEIIIDIPSRLRIGDPLPVLLIIKDADKYPVEIIRIEMRRHDNHSEVIGINRPVNKAYEDLTVQFGSSDFSAGLHYLAIGVTYKIRGKTRFCLSDNHRGTSHAPLPIYMSFDALPRFDHCVYGETHCHTNFTSDQVEFGASLRSTKSIARAMDLDFFCATDHSYDMDDFEDNYLENDPDLKKWLKFRHEVESLNLTDDRFTVIPGEEVTVRNSRNKNVHLLVYNSEKLFPGSGDSGEKWFRTRSERSIDELAAEIDEQVVLFAAHPAETPPFLQRLFIQRGIWEKEDCRQPGLHGLQFFNGGETIYNTLGKTLWIHQLLNGHRLTGLAGNDAHGNFSRFRQVGFPFFTMRENYFHLFGRWRTGVYLDSRTNNTSAILDRMKAGRCFMTNGPALQLHVESGGKWQPMGAVCSNPTAIRISVLSTTEFSSLKEIKIIGGDLNTKSEFTLFSQTMDEETYHFSKVIPFKNHLIVKGYIRAEVMTQENFEAYSNPVWIDHL